MSYNASKKTNDVKKTNVVNPAKTIWGKIIILFLALSMVVASVITIIYYLFV